MSSELVRGFNQQAARSSKLTSWGGAPWRSSTAACSPAGALELAAALP
jgi:hypothetical protein